MSQSFTTQKTCVATIKLLGDYWTLRIIDTLKQGEARFCEIQRKLDNVNPVTLTARLKNLEKSGVIARHEEMHDKISVSYSLTELGSEAIPVIQALDRFAAKARQVDNAKVTS